jgi:hypothetical protein
MPAPPAPEAPAPRLFAVPVLLPPAAPALAPVLAPALTPPLAPELLPLPVTPLTRPPHAAITTSTNAGSDHRLRLTKGGPSTGTVSRRTGQASWLSQRLERPSHGPASQVASRPRRERKGHASASICHEICHAEPPKPTFAFHVHGLLHGSADVARHGVWQFSPDPCGSSFPRVERNAAGRSSVEVIGSSGEKLEYEVAPQSRADVSLAHRARRMAGCASGVTWVLKSSVELSQSSIRVHGRIG